MASNDENLVNLNEVLRRGPKKNQRVGILAGGGGMAGIYSAGFLAGMAERGITEDRFDFAAGVSVGGIDLALYIGNRIEVAIHLYRALCNTRFMNLFRLNKMVDIFYAMQELRKRLDLATLLKKRVSFYVCVTDCVGTGTLLDVTAVKDVEEIAMRIMASASVPLRINPVVEVAGRGYLDGEISMPLPVREVVKQFSPTHLLIILNRPLYWRQNWVQTAAMAKFLQPFTGALNALRRQSEVYQEGLEFLRSPVASGIEISVVCPRKGEVVSEMCHNRFELQSVFDNAKQRALEIFGGRV